MRAYLAGPDVFLMRAREHADAKIAICAKFGIEGCAPLLGGDIEMMRECDLIIANLTPFRGSSADAGTLVELGWFLGQAKPVFGYSNSAELFDARSYAYLAMIADPVPHLAVEGFGLPDNLMVSGAVEYGGGLAVMLPRDQKTHAFDSLDIFEQCVAAVAKALGLQK
jgi:nucleoside 2-deoxyribosyltransferase